MTGIIAGVILIIFGIANIYLGIVNSKLKEKIAIVKGINLEAGKVMVIGKNKIRWEDSNGRGFEIALTELKGEAK